MHLLTALPLLLTHGWPCTFVEFIDVIGPPRGGHFAATEQPALFTDDLRAFFGPLR